MGGTLHLTRRVGTAISRPPYHTFLPTRENHPAGGTPSVSSADSSLGEGARGEGREPRDAQLQGGRCRGWAGSKPGC